MRIAILTIGSLGDVRPYVALGRGLRAAGFEVTLATHTEFEDLIRSHGLDFKIIRGNPRAMLGSPEGQALLTSGTSLRKFTHYMRAAAEPEFDQTCDDALAACEGVDVLMLSFLMAGLGSLLARARNLPTILAFLQPLSPTGAFPAMNFPSLYLGGLLNRLSHHLAYQIFWQVFLPLLTRWSEDRLQLKASAWAPYSWLQRRSLVLYGFSRMLVPRPPDWPANVQITGPWQLPEPEGYTPPPELAAFLAEGPPPVYAGFGSMTSADPERITQMLSEALRTKGMRGLLLRGWGGLEAASLPEGLAWVEPLPHAWLFPRCAGVIHHGGAGTTHAAVSAGVPSLGLPFFGDQEFWAHRVFGMGAGPRPVYQRKLDQATLTTLVGQLTSTPRYAKRAQELAIRMRSEGGVPEAVKLTKRFLKV